MRLEILSRRPQGASGTPILFVHGAYVGAWCWEEHFLDWFAARGYDAYAVSLRGHGASPGRERLDEFGLADFAHDIAEAVAVIGRPPVLVGHSMGALVAQKFLDSGAEVPAMVLACPVPGYGLLPSTFALAFTRPALFAGIQSFAAGGAASPEVFAESMFAGGLDPVHRERHFRRMRRESRRALFDMSGWGLPQPWRLCRPRTLVLGAAKDALIHPLHAQAAATLLGAEYLQLEGLGHALMLDSGWERAAEAIGDWLEAGGL